MSRTHPQLTIDKSYLQHWLIEMYSRIPYDYTTLVTKQQLSWIITPITTETRLDEVGKSRISYGFFFSFAFLTSAHDELYSEYIYVKSKPSLVQHCSTIQTIRETAGHKTREHVRSEPPPPPPPSHDTGSQTSFSPLPSTSAAGNETRRSSHTAGGGDQRGGLAS